MTFTGQAEIIKNLRVGDTVLSHSNEFGCDNLTSGRSARITFLDPTRIDFNGCNHIFSQTTALTVVATEAPRFVDGTDAPATTSPRFIVAWDHNGKDPVKFFATFKEAKAHADQLADDKQNVNIRIVQIAKLWNATRKVTTVVKLQPNA